ncbi:MAG: RNA polymerase sigma-70 factor [Bacteroidota bacterium]
MGKSKDIRNKPVLEESFEKIYSEFFHRMFLYARKLLKSDHLAEDAVEEVFFNLWKSKSNLAEIEEIETYLFVSVRNQAVRMLSKDPNAFISLDVKSEITRIEQSNPEDLLLEKELVSLIDKEISNLSEQCQVIFRLSRNEHKDYKEIAIEMGISVDSVKSQIYKATTKIKECIHHWKNEDSKDRSLFKDYGGLLLLIISYFLR